jgi:DNA-binding transcriptional LysR family regulator
MAINLHHLAVFEAVARRGNVTAAAASLMVSQPAVSKQIKQLEQAMGVRLIQRSRRGVSLTEAGSLLADYARKITKLSKDAEAAISDLQSLRKGSLHVAASPTIAAYLLPRVLVRYRLKYPGIRLKVEIEQAAALYRQMDGDHSIDVGLTEMEPVDDRLAFTVFTLDTFLAIVPTGHALTRRRTVDAARFVEAGLLLRDSDSATGSFVEQCLRQAGIKVRASLRLNTTEAIKEAVAAGLGVGIVSGLAVRSDIANKRIATVSLKGLTIRRPLYQISRHGHGQSKAVTAFLYMLKHAARGTLPGFDKRITPAI